MREMQLLSSLILVTTPFLHSPTSPTRCIINHIIFLTSLSQFIMLFLHNLTRFITPSLPSTTQSTILFPPSLVGIHTSHKNLHTLM